MINLFQIHYKDDYKTFLEQISKLIQCGYLNHKKIYHYGNKADEAIFIRKLYNSYFCKKLFPYFSIEEPILNIKNIIKPNVEEKNTDILMLLL